MAKRIDVDTLTSHHRGLKGIFENLLRRFKTAMHILTMFPVYFFGAAILGLCLAPGIALFRWILNTVADTSAWTQNFAYGLGLAFAFLLYGITLIFVAPLVNALLRVRLKPWRGPYYSAESFQWFLHNALTYLPRFTFLDFITPSPLSVLFYQMMGMKIGRGTVINTTYISDPSLITLGKKVTLGGSVTIVAHYGQAGLLVIAPVHIGDNCTVGLKATVMGGAVIGANAKILPHSVVMPKTIIPEGETWGGVPARRIEISPAPSKKSA